MTRLAVRKRPDLILTAAGEGTAAGWIATDPIALRYFHLRPEECFILRLLDGQTSIEEIVEKVEAAFVPLRIAPQELHAFVMRLHEQGLTISDSAGQGGILFERHVRRESRTQRERWSNLLAWRFPGIAAEYWLKLLQPYCGWFLAPLTIGALLILAAITFCGMLIRWEMLQSKFALTHSIFVPQAAWGMLVVLAIVKGLHELGHGLMCRRFGATCHEIGVMLLIGAPTLYCDVTDAWRLSNKWERILVSAAGMLVELFLATLAAWLWWYSSPGLLNTLALQVMFVCSVGTFLFNLNPLVRCDGYYMLADWWEQPNLWQDSRLLAQQRCWEYCLGLEFKAAERPEAETHRLLGYAIASIVYSWCLLAFILFFIYRCLEPHGFGLVAVLLSAVTVGGGLFTPLWQIGHALRHPGRKPLKRGRVLLSLVAAISLVAIIFWLPLPKTIVAPAWLEVEGSAVVFISVGGQLQEVFVKPGDRVAQGQMLAKLKDPAFELQAAEIAATVQLQEVKLKNLRLLLAGDPSVGPLIPTAEKSLQASRERQQQIAAEVKRLTIVAPQAGVVLPPPAVRRTTSQTELSAWQGAPFDPQNRGAWLETGTRFCQVAPTHRFSAIVVLDEDQRLWVEPKQSARLKSISFPGKIVTGRVVELAMGDEHDLPTDLAAALKLSRPAVTNNLQASGAEWISKPTLAHLELKKTETPLLTDLVVQAHLSAAWEPLAPRAWRLLERTFRTR